MKLNDLKISTQLRLGAGVILGLVVALGALAWIQTDRIMEQAQIMHNHPLQVRSALGQVEVLVERMSRLMRDLFLAQNDQEKMAARQNLDLDQAESDRQFTILFDRYLGPREDLTALHMEFIKWNTARAETLRLFQAGQTTEAQARIRPGGVQAVQAALVKGALQKVDDFARNKAAQLYQDSAALDDAVDHQMAALTLGIVFLSGIGTWWLIKRITAPMAELTAVAAQLRKGERGVRCQYASANEIGTLSAAFNDMADTVQTEMQVNESAARLAGVLLQEEEVHAFGRELLTALLQQTNSQVGAVFLLNEAKTDFEHFASIGLGAGGRAAFSATRLEGELGAALATRQIQRITDIPAETRFTFAAVSGDFLPREILTIPVLSDHGVSAVISLASVHSYDEVSLRLVNDTWSLLTARVNGVLAFGKAQALAERLELQNRELDAQKNELTKQADELAEQNTELEMQKRELAQASRLKSAFLSNMSHELRTPLNSVIALTGVLNRRLAGTIPPEECGYLEIIERNGRNLLRLINDILDLARIEAGREELNVSRFSLRDLAGEVVALLQPQTLEKKLALRNQVPADLPLIASDLVKCQHILQNLVGNAIKFTEQGWVEMAARLDGPDLLLTVTDTGIGIAAGQLPHIFDEFRQADDSIARKHGGAGLGLAIARKYALLLGGGLTVASTPGQGSTFTLRLPVAGALPSPAPMTKPAGPPPASPAARGQTILVVEDNEAAIIQLTDILRTEGYRVQVARNGGEALAQIAQAMPEAMILDLMMPEVDGFQVLKSVRSAPRTAPLPVLILTAKHVTREELSFLQGNHVHQFIQKGDINKLELLAAVARLVNPPPAAPTPPPSRRRRPARAGKPLVLVVEDNPDNRRAARALLQDRYEVVEAEDGRAGLAQARAHQPDLILMDISMPVLDGVQTLQEIRRDELLRPIPVIAVTASVMKGDRETILAHGFDGYLSKPIDHEALLKTLREMLD